MSVCICVYFGLAVFASKRPYKKICGLDRENNNFLQGSSRSLGTTHYSLRVLSLSGKDDTGPAASIQNKDMSRLLYIAPVVFPLLFKPERVNHTGPG